MKTYNPIVHIFSLACACLILVGCETTQQSAATAPPPPNSARLHVDRVANFGSDLVLLLSIDGKDVGSFTEGNSYNGYLSPGQHTITARVSPNETGISPARKTLNVKVRRYQSIKQESLSCRGSEDPDRLVGIAERLAEIAVSFWLMRKLTPAK
jgi:hypothetical protein